MFFKLSTVSARFPEKLPFERCQSSKDCDNKCKPGYVPFCLGDVCTCAPKQEFEVDSVIVEAQKNEKLQPHQTGL